MYAVYPVLDTVVCYIIGVEVRQAEPYGTVIGIRNKDEITARIYIVGF